ncbi:MAG TPA: bifunctional molybdenum cofactor biosynthesis protein MoaC/MoaB [Candidatus Limnocylindrales bacterium]
MADLSPDGSNGKQLTHVDDKGAARMVDVTDKGVSVRRAVAAGEVHTTPEVLELLNQGVPKGDAIGVARLAGIMAAKRTPDLIPLCHPIAIHGVTVELTPFESGVRIEATVRTADRTGVEMEALTCVTVAGLAFIDMIKAVDPAASIHNVRVLRKEGGKTGLWTNEPSEDLPVEKSMTAVVIVASTRAATGVYADTGGPLLVAGLERLGCKVLRKDVVVDGEPVREALRAALESKPDVVVTTGGTGVNPNDSTPEMTESVLDYQVPGIADAIRTRGKTPLAALSRGVAGVSGRTLIVNLPGSTGGVRDGLAVLGDVLAHTVEQLKGGDH